MFGITKVAVPVFNTIKTLICSDFYRIGIRAEAICMTSCTATREATILAENTKQKNKTVSLKERKERSNRRRR